MIPKVIHYCWFGGGPMTELAKKCIASWDKYLPDYKKVLWNEDTFDITSNKFAQEAYQCKKFAFVSDYVRLYALYNYGGIYIDVDVEVVKNINKFLVHPAFSGFENPTFLQSGIIGAVKQHPWIGRFLEFYKDKSFFRKNGSMDMFPNVLFMTRISENEFGLNRDNTFQILKDDVYVYPNDYFCPKVWKTKKIIMTENTHTIHHFAASWR